jgi:NADPH-dependent 2,4-dienoyl-CoA reductase/sulfur reductase-like enzyme
MTTDLRIPNHPHLKIERGEPVTFQFNGKPMAGYTGETIAAALYAGGLRIFSRSFKYHRPRGLFCLAGHCSHCLMRVDGIPNVRICKITVQAGMKVESQNAWPSLKFDVAAVSGYLDFLIRPGFQYRRFIRPRWLYHIWERFLRRMAGIGTLPDVTQHSPPRRLSADPEVVVVGGGIAGLSATVHAAQAGAEVWLIEKEDIPGGRIQYDTSQFQLPDSDTRQYGFDIVKNLTQEVMRLANCRVVTAATAFAWYDEDILAVARQGELWELKPKRVVVATGSYETPMVFENNDLPGIFLAGGLQRLMHRDYIRPGNTAVVVTNNDGGYGLAHQLMDAGVAVSAIIDNRQDKKAIESMAFQKAKDAAISIFPQHDLDAALGRRHVNGVRIKPINTKTGGVPVPEIKIACDVICIAGSRNPATELIFQRTSQGQYTLESPHQFMRRPVTTSHMKVESDMYVAGEAGGSRNLNQSWIEGKVAGLSAALDLGYGNKETESAHNEARMSLDELF